MTVLARGRVEGRGGLVGQYELAGWLTRARTDHAALPPLAPPKSAGPAGN